MKPKMLGPRDVVVTGTRFALPETVGWLRGACQFWQSAALISLAVGACYSFWRRNAMDEHAWPLWWFHLSAAIGIVCYLIALLSLSLARGVVSSSLRVSNGTRGSYAIAVLKYGNSRAMAAMLIAFVAGLLFVYSRSQILVMTGEMAVLFVLAGYLLRERTQVRSGWVQNDRLTASFSDIDLAQAGVREKAEWRPSDLDFPRPSMSIQQLDAVYSIADDRVGSLRVVALGLAAVATGLAGPVFLLSFHGDPGPQVGFIYLPIALYVAAQAVSLRSRRYERFADRCEATRRTVLDRLEDHAASDVSGHAHPKDRVVIMTLRMPKLIKRRRDS